MSAIWLALTFGLTAQALTPVEAIDRFSTASSAERLIHAEQACTELFTRSDYADQVRLAGARFAAEPEATHFVLRHCQAKWEAAFLNPLKLSQFKDKHRHAELAARIAAYDLLTSYALLKEQVALFLELSPARPKQAPQAPYELLSGLATPQRELDETLHAKVNQSIAALAATGGATFTALSAGKRVALFAGHRAQWASRIVKSAVALTAIFYGAHQAAEWGLWHARRSDLEAQTLAFAQQLSSPHVPAFVSAQEFSRAVERLGYFHSYELLLKDLGLNAAPLASPRCERELADFVASKTLPQPAKAYPQGVCPDAANLWLHGAAVLLARLPNDPMAAVWAERLTAKANLALWMYEETKAYNASLPRCAVDPHSPSLTLTCVDPKTGAPLL